MLLSHGVKLTDYGLDPGGITIDDFGENGEGVNEAWYNHIREPVS